MGALVLAVVATIVVISTVFSVTFERIITDQTATLVEANLAQVRTAVAGLNDSVQRIATQVFFDTTIRRLFLNRAPGDAERSDALDQLDTYRFTSAAVESLYLYNKTTATVYVSSDHVANKVQPAAGFFDNDLLALVRSYPYERPLAPVARSIPLGDAPDAVGQTYSGYTFLYFDSLSPSASANLVVINVSQAGITRVLAGIDQATGGTTVVLDAARRLVAGAGPWPLLSDLSSEPFVRTLLAARQGTGFATVTVGGARTYMAGTEPDVNGWRYVTLTPVDRVTARSRALRNQVLAFALAILVAGLLVVGFFSWRLYAPMRSVLTQMRRMERENTENRSVVRGELLRKLIEGYEGGDDATVRGLFEKLDMDGATGGGIVLVLVLVDAHGQFLRDHAAPERTRMKQDIVRALLAALPTPLAAECVDMGDDRLVALVPLRGAAWPAARPGLENAFGAAQHAVARQHGLSLTFVVEPGESTGHVSFLYSQALKDSFYRFFLGRGSIITPEATTRFTVTEFTGQEKKEARLVDAIMLANVAEARERLQEIVADISRCASATASLALSHLVFTVTTAVETLRKNNFPGVPAGAGDPRSLADVDTAEEMTAAFSALFESTATLMERRHRIKHESLVGQVTAFVDREYGNRNMCLKFIAAEMGLSANYLGRLFHKVTATSITDYINEVRMNVARRLLAEGDLTIAEIATKVGFTNDGYFYKAFKKQHALTPAEFRQSAGRLA